MCPIPYASILLQKPTSATAQSYAEKYKSWKPFLLYPGQTWRHKNHIRLLQALHKVRRELNLDLHLICTGHLCNRVILIDRSTIAHDGPTHQVVRDYLGTSRSVAAERKWQHSSEAPGNNVVRTGASTSVPLKCKHLHASKLIENR